MAEEKKEEERGKIAHGEEGSGEANRGRQTMSSGAHPHLHINTHTYGPCSNHGSYMYTHPSTLAYIPFQPQPFIHFASTTNSQASSIHIRCVCWHRWRVFFSPMEENFLIIIELLLLLLWGRVVSSVWRGRWKEATNECVEWSLKKQHSHKSLKMSGWKILYIFFSLLPFECWCTV